MRLNCQFEYLREGEDTNYDKQPKAIIFKPQGVKHVNYDAYGNVPEYLLPCLAKVLTISVVDLKQVRACVWLILEITGHFSVISVVVVLLLVH